MLLWAAAALALAERGGAPCTTPLDCQLNGNCTAGACVCQTAWSGANCSTLRLLSPPGFSPAGFHSLDSASSAWGGGAVYDPSQKKWVGAFHEISHTCGMGTWGANGQTRLAESVTPAGPFKPTTLLLPPMATNPSIDRDRKTGTILITHIGMGNATKCFSCTEADGITQPADKAKGMIVPCGDPKNPPLFTGAATGLMSATSFDGPWSTEGGMMPNPPNAAPLFARDGSVIINAGSGTKINNARCNNQNAFLRLHKAESLAAAKAGKWTEIPITYQIAGTNETDPDKICFNWEDNHVWQDRQGHFHAIFHAWRGQPTDYPRPVDLFPGYSGCSTNVTLHGSYDTEAAGVFCTSLGGHAFSLDGSHWHISPVPVYTPIVTFPNASGGSYELFFRARERPHMILDEDGIVGEPGDLAALSTAMGNPGVHPGSKGSGGNCGTVGNDHTFTLIQPIANTRHSPPVTATPDAEVHAGGGYGGRGFH